MRRAAIVAPVRTAVGTFGGALRPLRAEDLPARVIEAVVSRSGVDPEAVEDVVFAQSYANSEAPCIGRWAALHAGLPAAVPGLQIDRRCGGGLQAVITAAMTVQTGAADVVLAGGVESMSNIEHYTTTTRWGARSGASKVRPRSPAASNMSTISACPGCSTARSCAARSPMDASARSTSRPPARWRACIGW